MKDSKIVLFPAFRYVVPADFENWLEGMAEKGWHIDRVRQWSSLVMTFKRGQPRKYRFVYDMRIKLRQGYQETYEQFGWQYLGRMASAHMWRMEYTNERPEAFSDMESLVARNRRTILAVSVSFTLFLLMVLVYAVLLIFFRDSMSSSDRTQLVAAGALFSVFILLLGAVMLCIHRNERR
jgi:uncharacterized membrane protein (DUF485 family)